MGSRPTLGRDGLNQVCQITKICRRNLKIMTYMNFVNTFSNVLDLGGETFGHPHIIDYFDHRPKTYVFYAQIDVLR